MFFIIRIYLSEQPPQISGLNVISDTRIHGILVIHKDNKVLLHEAKNAIVEAKVTGRNARNQFITYYLITTGCWYSLNTQMKSYCNVMRNMETFEETYGSPLGHAWSFRPPTGFDRTYFECYLGKVGNRISRIAAMSTSLLVE